MLHALVHVQTAVPQLPVAGGTHALVAALRIEAPLLAPVLTGGAFVHVAAAPAVAVERVAGRTRALVRAERVVTLVFTGVRYLSNIGTSGERS